MLDNRGLQNALRAILDESERQFRVEDLAGIGVQSKANKERDFNHGKPLHFLAGGVVGTAVFISCILLFVQYLIHS